jgi:glycerophosphoryl diester phosphodiesterase
MHILGAMMISAALAASLMTAPIAVPKPLTADIISRSWSQTLVVGHRGAAAYKPENTVESFEEAIRSGAVATECDIHTDLGGEVVVIHDSTLDRTTSLKGKVAETSTEALRAAGVPFLADYTRVTKDRIVSVIEIKAGQDVEAKTVSHLQKEKMLDQSIVFSFGAERVAKTKELEPKLFSVWLIAAPGAPAGYEANVFARATAIKADAIGVQFRNATPELASMARQKGVPLFVWTVPPGPEVDRLKQLKVNFIITDHPRDVIAQLGKP